MPDTPQAASSSADWEESSEASRGQRCAVQGENQLRQHVLRKQAQLEALTCERDAAISGSSALTKRLKRDLEVVDVELKVAEQPKDRLTLLEKKEALMLQLAEQEKRHAQLTSEYSKRIDESQLTPDERRVLRGIAALRKIKKPTSPEQTNLSGSFSRKPGEGVHPEDDGIRKTTEHEARLNDLHQLQKEQASKAVWYEVRLRSLERQLETARVMEELHDGISTIQSPDELEKLIADLQRERVEVMGAMEQKVEAAERAVQEAALAEEEMKMSPELDRDKEKAAPTRRSSLDSRMKVKEEMQRFKVERQRMQLVAELKAALAQAESTVQGMEAEYTRASSAVRSAIKALDEEKASASSPLAAVQVAEKQLLLMGELEKIEEDHHDPNGAYHLALLSRDELQMKIEEQNKAADRTAQRGLQALAKLRETTTKESPEKKALMMAQVKEAVARQVTLWQKEEQAKLTVEVDSLGESQRELVGLVATEPTDHWEIQLEDSQVALKDVKKLQQELRKEHQRRLKLCALTAAEARALRTNKVSSQRGPKWGEAKLNRVLDLLVNAEANHAELVREVTSKNEATKVPASDFLSAQQATAACFTPTISPRSPPRRRKSRQRSPDTVKSFRAQTDVLEIEDDEAVESESGSIEAMSEPKKSFTRLPSPPELRRGPRGQIRRTRPRKVATPACKTERRNSTGATQQLSPTDDFIGAVAVTPHAVPTFISSETRTPLDQPSEDFPSAATQSYEATLPDDGSGRNTQEEPPLTPLELSIVTPPAGFAHETTPLGNDGKTSRPPPRRPDDKPSNRVDKEAMSWEVWCRDAQVPHPPPLPRLPPRALCPPLPRHTRLDPPPLPKDAAMPPAPKPVALTSVAVLLQHESDARKRVEDCHSIWYAAMTSSARDARKYARAVRARQARLWEEDTAVLRWLKDGLTVRQKERQRTDTHWQAGMWVKVKDNDPTVAQRLRKEAVQGWTSRREEEMGKVGRVVCVRDSELVLRFDESTVVPFPSDVLLPCDEGDQGGDTFALLVDIHDMLLNEAEWLHTLLRDLQQSASQLRGGCKIKVPVPPTHLSCDLRDCVKQLLLDIVNGEAIVVRSIAKVRKLLRSRGHRLGDNTPRQASRAVESLHQAIKYAHVARHVPLTPRRIDRDVHRMCVMHALLPLSRPVPKCSGGEAVAIPTHNTPHGTPPSRPQHDQPIVRSKHLRAAKAKMSTQHTAPVPECIVTIAATQSRPWPPLDDSFSDSLRTYPSTPYLPTICTPLPTKRKPATKPVKKAPQGVHHLVPLPPSAPAPSACPRRPLGLRRVMKHFNDDEDTAMASLMRDFLHVLASV